MTTEKKIKADQHRARHLVLDALRELETAQNHVRNAAEALCPVRGLSDEYGATWELHDAIRKHWNQVENGLLKIIGTDKIPWDDLYGHLDLFDPQARELLEADRTEDEASWEGGNRAPWDELESRAEGYDAGIGGAK